jgi:hypothetical protein
MIDAAKMGTYLHFGNTLPRALSEFATPVHLSRDSATAKGREMRVI